MMNKLISYFGTFTPGADGAVGAFQFEYLTSLGFAALVIFAGRAIVRRSHVLRKFAIPAPVISGLLFSVLIAIFKGTGILAISFDTNVPLLFMTCRNRVYSPELKRQAVEDYLSGIGSQAELSKKYGLRDRRQLRNWLKVYNAHGDFNSRKNSGGGSYMKQGRDTTQEERIQIVKDCLASGKDYGEMALKLQGKLPAGTHMDAAVRGDGRGRSGGPARKEEEGSGAQNRAGESADRD